MLYEVLGGLRGNVLITPCGKSNYEDSAAKSKRREDSPEPVRSWPRLVGARSPVTTTKKDSSYHENPGQVPLAAISVRLVRQRSCTFLLVWPRGPASPCPEIPLDLKTVGLI